MYVSRVKIRNIRCCRKLEIRLPAVAGDGNWIVLLGENGVGKSTILRAIALALSPERTAIQLLARPAEWLRDPNVDGRCEVTLGFSPEESHTGPVSTELAYRIGKSQYQRGISGEAVLEYLDKGSPDTGKAMENLFGSVVAGYGAYRRPVASERRGSDSRTDQWFETLFDDCAGVPDLEAWLMELDYRSRSGTPEQRASRENLLQVVKAVVKGLMPEGQRYDLDISPDGVMFRRQGSPLVPLAGMSDGYRAMFALAADLVRRLTHRGDLHFRMDRKQLVFDEPGIVLIDEVDAHLHPKWQREIGFYLQRLFPKVQFIVATHSPFVAQAASPEGIVVLRQKGQGVEVDDTLVSLRGISAGDILQSKAFDLGMLRDLETETLLKEHAALSDQLSAGTLPEAKRRRLSLLDQVVSERQAPAQPKSDVLAELERVIREVKQRHD